MGDKKSQVPGVQGFRDQFASRFGGVPAQPQRKANPIAEMLGPIMNGSLGMLTNEEVAAMQARQDQPRMNPFAQRMQAMFSMNQPANGAPPVAPGGQDPRMAIIQALMANRGGSTPPAGGYSNGW